MKKMIGLGGMVLVFVVAVALMQGIMAQVESSLDTALMLRNYLLSFLVMA